jgi:hypothetical protein
MPAPHPASPLALARALHTARRRSRPAAVQAAVSGYSSAVSRVRRPLSEQHAGGRWRGRRRRPMREAASPWTGHVRRQIACRAAWRGSRGERRTIVQLPSRAAILHPGWRHTAASAIAAAASVTPGAVASRVGVLDVSDGRCGRDRPDLISWHRAGEPAHERRKHPLLRRSRDSVGPRHGRRRRKRFLRLGCALRRREARAAAPCQRSAACRASPRSTISCTRPSTMHPP